ncbi:MAG: hypothetical protein CMK09_19035 [Ponticaulis sp.]|nr:hypothetical protein [Ponticaulis sp.]|tara:strand:+ start:177414 stop:178235 length:822 start_codon:yes stop_codon:yes gene_type:complete
MVSLTSPHTRSRPLDTTLLWASTRFWFAVTLIGQLAFTAFILGFYGTRTASGNFAAWDDKPTIHAYEAGDLIGNLVFITHVLLAAVITLSGLIQLLPVIRKKWPKLHRWSGRIFILLGMIGAVSGIWLTWVRGSQVSLDSAIAVSLNGVLILWTGGLAWRHALRRQFATHEQWALRAFMLISGVWFFRLAIMAWTILGRGVFRLPASSQAIADPILEFGSYLLPLLVLELYFLARRRKTGALTYATAGIITVCTCLMAVGVFGAISFMWLPNL